MGECEPRNFLQPCLLLLLRERSDHGYDLVARLHEMHAPDGDAGAVYRALRGLERQGLVRSTWHTSSTGPARRTYQVTALGVAALARHAEELEEAHLALHLFRERYARLTAPPSRGHDGVAAAPGEHVRSTDKREVSGNVGPAYGGTGGRGVRPASGAGKRAGR
jgi:PadR family transcriptional regulator, regulatory protein PadR